MKKILKIINTIFLATLLILTSACSQKNENTEQNNTTQTNNKYIVKEEEKTYLKNKFKTLTEQNKDTIGYIYIPGTKLDEVIVQTTDNTTYLEKTFEGKKDPFLGTVFMDMDNTKDFTNSLTWLFGHARGSKVADNRMFNDINYYQDQTYFNEHLYTVIETPERKYYYEAAFLIIVPEDTAFYKTSFESLEQFEEQLKEVSEKAYTKNEKIKINKNDKYLVASTCREDDTTIRANLYLRQIPDEELNSFLEKNSSKLDYKATR